MAETFDIAIIGAGAAGLMAAIHAARTAPGKRIIILDGAKTLGAKILVAGGGRCNVTHHAVDETAFAGSSRNAIRKVLRRFDVPQTVEFFRELGVTLKREETGKLFPITDRARTVLDALLNEAGRLGVEIRHPWRVERIERGDDAAAFTIVSREGERLSANRIILATGGKSLPKTGSDGHGYTIAQSLGHSITPRVFPALVPLTLPADHFICGLSGITLPATLEVRSSTGKKLATFTNSTLCTHFGLSGPSVLDISRYLLDARMDDPDAMLIINWLPGETPDSIDRWLLATPKRNPVNILSRRLPERLARAICETAIGGDVSVSVNQLPREARRSLVRFVAEMPLPIIGDRGYTHAEVTAGGVPLAEIELSTMHSRRCDGLYLCGEICDVDGRIGGFNFQWAWSSGHVTGTSAARA